MYLATPAPQYPRNVVRRSALRVAVVVVTVVLGSLTLSAPASAHAALVSSTPAAGQNMTAALESVDLTFSETIAEPAYVALLAPDGSRVALGEPRVRDTLVSADVPPLTDAGTYQLSFRVISADGHPVQGTMEFTVADSALVSASATAPASATPDTATTSSSASTSSPGFVHEHRGHLIWGAAAVVVAIALIAWPLVRRRSEA